MDPFNTNQVQNNANVYHARLFREIAYTSFLEDLISATCGSMISNIHRNKFGAVIRQPEMDRSKIVVNKRDAYQCELDINSTIETDETIFTMGTALDATFEICPWDEAYTEPNLTQEAMRLVNEEIMLAVDNFILEEAIAQATNTVGAITDAASAEAVICEVEGMFVGLRSLPGTRVIVAANTMYAFFKELFVSRMTVLGDEVFLSGQLKTIAGWDICFIDSANHPDPTKVIFAVGKPLDTYIDEAGFSHGERFKESGDPTKVNLNKVYFHQLNIGTKVWNTNQVRLVIAG